MEAIISGLESGAGTAFRGLFAFGVIAFMYNTAKEMLANDDPPKPFALIWKGFITCGAISLFMASLVGEPSCEDQGDYREGCETYADDEYEATSEERAKTFALLFLLSYGPLVVAALDGKKRGALSQIGIGD